MYIPRVSHNDGILSISGKPLLRARCSILGYFKAMDSRGVALSSELPMFDFIPLECKCICKIQVQHVGEQGQTDPGRVFCADKGG